MKVLSGFIALLAASAAHAADPALAVAGRGTTLEQAVSAGMRLGRVTASRADAGTRKLLERARRDGAVVFVCEKDLHSRHLRRSDLLPGVLAVDAADVWENGEPKHADRLLRRFCS